MIQTYIFGVDMKRLSEAVPMSPKVYVCSLDKKNITILYLKNERVRITKEDHVLHCRVTVMLPGQIKTNAHSKWRII